MKSVCILLQNHYEIDIRVRRKAEALAAAGYAVDVLALRTPGSREKVFELNGVSVQTVALGKERGSLARYFLEYVLFFLWCFWKLVGLMGRQQYAVVDVNNLPDFLVFAAAYARWKGAKIVLDMHEITPEFYISKYGVKESSWTVRLLKWSERISFEYADHVITINEPIRDLLVSRGLCPHKCSIVMNSADESLFPAPAGRAAVARPPEAAKFVMMYHGTLTRIYGLDIAVEAFARVHQQMPEAEMIILGGGPEKARLEEMIRELGLEQKARLAGVVRPEAVPQWVSRCDAAVLATRRDVFLDYSFSNKLSEYVIMGKPVIASRLKTIRHYFSENALAYFEPNNPEDLSRQMLRLYRDPALCARLAQSARREYAPICWEVMKSGYLEMMKGFLEADRAAQDARCAEARA